MAQTLQEIKKHWGIGLTGGMASGKSTAGKILLKLGFHVVDADQLVRQAMLPDTLGYQELVDLFGPSILHANGLVDRTALRTLVSQSEEKLKSLETVIHRHLDGILEDNLRQNKIFAQPHFWFYEASLLIELGRHQDYWETWLLVAPREIQFTRVQDNRGLTSSEVGPLLARQWNSDQQIPFATFVLENKGSITDLEQGLALQASRLRKIEHDREKTRQK
jgi:dephospho-CoA kinase